MTICFLVRHAAHDLLHQVLVGRQDGAPLSEAGHAEVVQARMVAHLDKRRAQRPRACIVMVLHAAPIRAAMLRVGFEEAAAG